MAPATAARRTSHRKVPARDVPKLGVEILHAPGIAGTHAVRRIGDEQPGFGDAFRRGHRARLEYDVVRDARARRVGSRGRDRPGIAIGADDCLTDARDAIWEVARATSAFHRAGS